jgi:hypothetical protein
LILMSIELLNRSREWLINRGESTENYFRFFVVVARST